MSGFDPGLRSSFFLIETLSITGQKFSKCLNNYSERLRKGNLHRGIGARLHIRGLMTQDWNFRHLEF